MLSAHDDLWSFSLRVYGTEPVPAACLWLQDQRAVDVNLLLYCCWLGSHGRALAPDTLAAAQNAVSPWAAEVVARLRSARRWMKTQARAGPDSSDRDHAALRKRIKAAELEAERLQQRMLEQLALPIGETATPLDEQLRRMIENTARYLASIDVSIDTEVAEQLEIVLAKASGASREDVLRQLARHVAKSKERG